ncbi:MAG: DUF4198 domain-containing protein [Rhodocyclaceae bacterium]|nr:DUF4198 domain-containing protein [Rhodocyclaceae bacterium]
MKRFSFPAALPIVACLAAPAALAHDLWLEKAGAHYTLYQGHRYSQHAGAETLDYGPHFVTAAACFDARGEKRPLKMHSASPWRASGDCAALRLEASSGYWSKTPWETKNVPKSAAPGAIKSWLAKEGITRLERWSAAFARPLTEGLELVPAQEPFAVKPGEKLVVQVFLAGKPQAGVPVAYHGETRGVTDAQGKIALRLRQAGVQLISVSLERPLSDGQADVEMLSATLQFELPQ